MAPILLVAMRVVQGIGLGGEGAGATLMSMEHAPAGKKNLYAGFPQMGTPAGLVLANGIFLTISSVMSDSAFASWGWRIPFVLSFVLVAIGLVIRLRVTESPSFTGIVENNAVSKFPLRESLKVGFPRLSLTLLAVLANSAVAYAFMVFSLSYGSQHLGYDKAVPDPVRDGRRGAVVRVDSGVDQGRRQARTPHDVIAGSAAILAWCIVFFPLLNTENSVIAVIAFLGMGLIVPSRTACRAASSPTPSPRRCATRGRR